MTGTKHTRESPERLRECLDTLSRAAGLAVYRCEFQFTGKGAQLILTCSPEVTEEAVAGLVLRQLQPMVNAAYPPSAELAALRAEIAALRQTGQKLANIAFNWKQEASVVGELIGAERRAELAELQAEWDTIAKGETP